MYEWLELLLKERKLFLNAFAYCAGSLWHLHLKSGKQSLRVNRTKFNMVYSKLCSFLLPSDRSSLPWCLMMLVFLSNISDRWNCNIITVYWSPVDIPWLKTGFVADLLAVANILSAWLSEIFFKNNSLQGEELENWSSADVLIDSILHLCWNTTFLEKSREIWVKFGML